MTRPFPLLDLLSLHSSCMITSAKFCKSFSFQSCLPKLINLLPLLHRDRSGHSLVNVLLPHLLEITHITPVLFDWVLLSSIVKKKTKGKL